MSNIASAFGEKVTRRAWNISPKLAGFLANFALPLSGSITYYDGQAMGRDASGNLVQCDDTLKTEFVGFETDVIAAQLPVASTDTIGDKRGDIDRPYAFVALIAAASAGQEGKKVWWLYNNQVAYSGLTNWNFAGTILGVLDSTHVLVLAPWCMGVTQGGDKGFVPITGATTLTKWDVNKAQVCNSGSAMAIALPAASSCSPGDAIPFVNINAASGTPTVSPAGSDKINGATSYIASTTQYAQWTLRCDGVSNWYVVTPNASGTLGATTFTGAITVSGAITVTDAAAQALAVGANGATNPVFSVDGSVSSVATGLNIQGQAAGSGLPLQVISSGTNEALTIDAKASALITLAGAASTATGVQVGSSTSKANVKLTVYSTNATAFQVGPNGATNPTLVAACSTSSAATGLKITSAAAASGVAVLATTSGTNENLTIDSAGSGTIGLNTVTGTGNVLCGTGVLVNASVSAGGVGYGTGAGGTVTQATSRTTGVTLSKLSGAITLVSAAGSATPFTMTVTNTLVAALDTVVVVQKSGTDAYSAVVSTVAAGSFKLTITDLTGTTTEQPVFNFGVFKTVAS